MIVPEEELDADVERRKRGSDTRELDEGEVDLPIRVGAPRPARLPRPDGLRPPSAPADPISSVPPRSSGVFAGASSGRRPSEERIDSSIEQLLASGHMDAAAKVARAAGRYDEAAEWFEQVGDRVNAAECFYELGWYQDALDVLSDIRAHHSDYRPACRNIARCAAILGRLHAGLRARLRPFIDSGPRSDQELSAFLDLAEMLWRSGERKRAHRCLAGVLRLDPSNDAAQLMQLTWAAEAASEQAASEG